MLRIDNPSPQGSSYASAGHLRFGAIGTDVDKNDRLSAEGSGHLDQNR